MAILLERHDQLDLPQYQRVAFEREAVEVAPGLRSGVARSRAGLLHHLESGAQAYGVNTGLGYLAGRVVEDVDQAAFQRSILAGRATGTGRRLSEPVVRGAMLLRLTGFLSGYAGVSPELCSLLVERLNDGWFPVVPGGVSGAAGEIVPLAHLFSALVDDARPAYSLGAKEGIALINGAPLAPALAVPLLLRAEALLEHATVCGALVIALTRAPARPYVVRVGELKGDRGQLAIHRRLGELLGPSGDRLGDARQAPVSLRVIPQVHGAALDVLEQLRGQLDRELRAVTDSPVFLGASEDGTEPEGLYPTGNFHAQALTLLLDYAAIALTQLLNLGEKRLHRLLDSRFSGLPDQLTPDPGRQSGVITLHKQVIGLAAQARGLAAPATIHAIDASTGQEDMQAHTLLAAQQLDGVLDALELSLAHELVALRQARFLAGTPLPAPLEHAAALLSEIVPPVTEDRSLAGDVSEARELVASGRLIGGVRCPSIWFSPTPG
ncbi:MAG TPA: aromatic amino acid lyase [Solirubrobacteraceae bacterium]|nr:aromatic amino acid lyase [Solirubrobacteraceae bacterium]